MSEDSKDKLSARAGEALKKALAAGVGAVFLTEEGIRHMVSDMKLPKEALSYLLQQTDRTRKDIFEAVSKEVKKYLRSKELEKLLSQMLEHFTIEVKAEIKFKTKDKGGVKVTLTDVTASTDAKNEAKNDAKDDDADEDES